VLMPSTPSAYAQCQRQAKTDQLAASAVVSIQLPPTRRSFRVVSRTLASSNSVFPQVTIIFEAGSIPASSTE
jgi:hypothetical protein